MSVVQICNRGGSQYLGVSRINSLDETTPQAEQYLLHYDDLRKSLLEQHQWFFTKRQVALAVTSNDKSDIWAYKYELPADIIKIHWINDPAVAASQKAIGANPDCERETIGRYVYCNVPLAYIEFTFNEKNTDLMPQYFKDALSAMVAAAVAMPLTESVSRARFATGQMEIMVDNAIARDEEQTPPIKTPVADYLAARGIR